MLRDAFGIRPILQLLRSEPAGFKSLRTSASSNARGNDVSRSELVDAVGARLLAAVAPRRGV
jgi:hypothetical protein